MNILFQLFVSVVGLLFAWVFGSIVMGLMFGRREKIEYVDLSSIPKPGELYWTPDIIPTKDSKWFKHYPERSK